MKLNKQAALLTLLWIIAILAVIVSVVVFFLYIPIKFIIGGICVFLFIGIIRGIYNIHCDNWDF